MWWQEVILLLSQIYNLVLLKDPLLLFNKTMSNYILTELTPSLTVTLCCFFNSMSSKIWCARPLRSWVMNEKRETAKIVVTCFSHDHSSPAPSSPNLSNAMAAWMTPQRRLSSTAWFGCPPTTEKHSRDIIAVGPSVISLEVPRRVYTNPPMKAE